jgi:hypothetical protein
MSERKKVVNVNNQDSVWTLVGKEGVLFWTSKMMVDADGHPQAYHPGGSPPGLDHLANAGKPGNWWGIACDKSGKPYVQKDEHAAPGHYVSTTALVDTNYKEDHPRRYVHSGEIPYFVLPGSPKLSTVQRLGDIALMFNYANGRKAYAVYADIGPANKIGEGSMRLCEDLGLSSDPKKGGTSQETIATIYFPGSYKGWPRLAIEMEDQAWLMFGEWGAYDSARKALPQIDWKQFEKEA